MNIQNRSKINSLISNWPKNTILVTSYLHEIGISNQLLAVYKKNKWVKSVGRGAYIKYNDMPQYAGALYALQK